MKLAALLALVAGCTSLRAEGEVCVAKQGGASSTGADIYYECEEGLYCSSESETCVSPTAQGGACQPTCRPGGECNTRCEEGLVCALGNTCQPPAAEGARCSQNAHCAAGLICNHGYVPDDITVGECHPPSTAGQPCSYAQFLGNGTGRPSGVGCTGATWCVPPTPTRASLESSPTGPACDSSAEDPSCGYAGTCEALFTVAEGSACLDGGSCANMGLCYMLPLPKGYQGPWPGLCGPGPDPAPQSGESCASTPCAPGYVCDHSAVCEARWQGTAGDRCDAMDGSPNHDLCALGLTCVDGTPPRCN